MNDEVSIVARPKPPAIKPLFALDTTEDRLGGKVTPSANGVAPTSIEERCSGKGAEDGRRVIYASAEGSGNWE